MNKLQLLTGTKKQGRHLPALQWVQIILASEETLQDLVDALREIAVWGNGLSLQQQCLGFVLLLLLEQQRGLGEERLLQAGTL